MSTEPENKTPLITIFIDAKKYEVDKTAMNGAEIKAKANIDARYQLFLEKRGDEADEPIPDNKTISLKEDMHFFAIPQATMG